MRFWDRPNFSGAQYGVLVGKCLRGWSDQHCSYPRKWKERVRTACAQNAAGGVGWAWFHFGGMHSNHISSEATWASILGEVRGLLFSLRVQYKGCYCYLLTGFQLALQWTVRCTGYKKDSFENQVRQMGPMKAWRWVYSSRRVVEFWRWFIVTSH